MAVSTKIIKRRLRSIGNTKKITKAMELVSAAKMRKVIQRTLASRAYAGTAWDLVQRIAGRVDYQHPLFGTQEHSSSSSESEEMADESRSVRQAPTTRSAVIVISSNRGLCGSFNANVAGAALKQTSGVVEYITLGKKARDVIRRHGSAIAADFEKKDVTTSVVDISPITRMALDGFLAGTYARVDVVYTDFVSSLSQKARVKQLLPFAAEEDPHLGKVARESNVKSPADAKALVGKQMSNVSFEYLIEPAPDIVLNDLLPRLVELQLYQAVLESDASEHSARMLAMRNASDAASDMMQELSLMYNQARQAGITKEIAEISGGKAALEQ
ncbi:ATP synthase F1 subunit gamma [Candidatus Uhrbacteria bacterium]|nr:ATP synthase F1 subunit gamma [Candidatus Uhrbacteria bacterium]